MSRTFSTYIFQPICELEVERDETEIIKEIYPQQKFNNPKGLKLNAYGDGPFCRFSIPPGWTGKTGVYIYLIDDKPMYIGECENLKSRFNSGYGNISPRNCFEGGQPTNCRINNLVLKTYQYGQKIQIVFHETADRMRVEDELITELKSPWNRSGGRRGHPVRPRKAKATTPPVSRDEISMDSTTPFGQFWQTLTSRLNGKTQIRNWTVDKGFLKRGDFMAGYRGGNYIICDAPDAKATQTVPRLDFELLYKHWQAYLSGHVSRRQLVKESRFTKYTISILHWFSDDGLG